MININEHAMALNNEIKGREMVGRSVKASHKTEVIHLKMN